MKKYIVLLRGINVGGKNKVGIIVNMTQNIDFAYQYHHSIKTHIECVALTCRVDTK